MMFEFDPRKSRSNEDKHGIDFVKAQEIWEDADFMEIPARTVDEPRFVVGHVLVSEKSTEVATSLLLSAMSRHGKTEAVRTDRGGEL